MVLISIFVLSWRVGPRVSTEISESPKFRETFRSVSVKRFAKFRIISEVSEAEILRNFGQFRQFRSALKFRSFPKFRSVMTVQNKA